MKKKQLVKKENSIKTERNYLQKENISSKKKKKNLAKLFSHSQLDKFSDFFHSVQDSLPKDSRLDDDVSAPPPIHYPHPSFLP